MLSLLPGLVAWEILQKDRDARIIYLGGGKLYMKAARTGGPRGGGGGKWRQRRSGKAKRRSTR